MKNTILNTHFNSIKLFVGAFLFLASTASAAYTYEVSAEQPWSDTATTDSSTQYVTVRAYVPGSNTLNYRSMPVYSSVTTSGANSIGDVVGYTSNIYGTSPAFIDPYDNYRYRLMYQAYGVMNTKLFTVNDQRLALGYYMLVGASVRPFVYDLIYKKYTLLPELNARWASVIDMNNHGQITGVSFLEDGAVRKGYAYDCQNGKSVIEVPTASWTIPHVIDDEGNIYGTHNALGADERYFIARPDTSTSDIGCSLVDREDTFEPLSFVNGPSFEMSGDQAIATSIADFDHGGTNDILVDHGEGKVILYLGEEDFDSKIKYYGESFGTIFTTEFSDVTVPAISNDINGDGYDDEIKITYGSIEFSLGKADGSFHYVPQAISGSKLTDLNDDGLLDTLTVSGGFISVRCQEVAVAPEPAPAPEPTPEPTPESVPTGNPYADTLEAEFPGFGLLKLSVDDETGEAEFKILHNGDKIEGLISTDYVIIEIYN